MDKVTKKFYDRFKAEHAAFLKFIKGIKAEADLEWYTSLMLNRLMFVYFIQKKGFLDGDTNYLQNRMRQVREIKGKDKFQSFYRYFLLRLFHDGLGKLEQERKLDRDLERLIGKVPYLNGGFFEVHQLEERNTDIDIPDKAFEKLFGFFDEFSLAPRRAPAAHRQRDQPRCCRLHLREVHQPEADGGLLHQGRHHRIHQQEHDHPVPVRRRPEEVPHRLQAGELSLAAPARRP